MQFIPAELARNVLDAAPDAMLIVDAGGVIVFANRQVATLFGYTHAQLIGKSVEQLMPERFHMAHAGLRQGYSRSPRLRPMGRDLALFGRRQDGSEFPVEISLSPVDPEQALVAAAIRDVTDRKRVEAQLRVAREVADQQRDSADRANQAKSRFLATASHDLRQPLQTLALLNGALRRVVTSPEAAEALAQQQQAVAAMSRLMNALLDISKLESGAVKPVLSDFKPGTLLEGLRGEFASVAASKGLELQAELAEDSVRSDPALLEQILKNLISNAIKYTPRGQVLLRCVRSQDSVRIEVHDTGIGIPADQLPYIYDEFFQVGVPANSSREGYGLGLSIVQRLVRLLGVRLEVVSEPGRGSVFSLILPAGDAGGAATASAAAPAAQAAPVSSRPRVLLVEDDAGVRDATRMLLRVEGYLVTAVANLSEALHSARREGVPELLITDFHLADGELGTQVIAALRAETGTELKAVLITGDTSAVIKEMAGDPHLRVTSKPVNAEELLELLRKLLGE
jgi:PAS domain S-box-containing protein